MNNQNPVFKSNWEKSYLSNPLTPDIINGIVKSAYSDTPIKDFQIIRDGCANINIKIEFINRHPDELLRIYLRDPSSAYKEQKIATLLKDKIPIPQIRQIFKYETYQCARMNFMPGITLRDFLLNTKNPPIEKIMHETGGILAQIASVHFDKTGFFNRDLEITTPFQPKDLIDFCNKTLKNETVRLILTDKIRDNITRLMTKNQDLLSTLPETNLVHADFDPSNILVDQRDGQVYLSAVLDWEFAFSGSTLCDVANMLRYAHKMPPLYQSAFLEGLTQGGYPLTDHYSTTIDLLNLISLIDCLARADPKNRPNQILDICDLIDTICLKHAHDTPK